MPISETYDPMHELKVQKEEAKSLLESEDTEIVSLAEDELSALDVKLEDIEYKLKIFLLPKDEADTEVAHLEIRGEQAVRKLQFL